MIFFTADQHFGHSNIIKHCDRPFQNVQEMDETLLTNWNAIVGSQDIVYILGDLFFRNIVPVADYLQYLKGKKHLLIGNHDKDWMKEINLSQYFESVERMVEINDGSHKITLCHYPMMSWDGIAKGDYMIHGHIHSNIDSDYFPLIRKMPNLLNAGVELNEYRPVNLNELLKNNIAYKRNNIA